MGFKEMVEKDVCEVFLDLEKFGEIHKIDGMEIPIVIDDDGLKRRQAGEELAIEEGSILFHCRTCDLSKQKKPGQSMEKDGRLYVVSDIQEDMGMSTVVLQENIVT